MLPAVTVTEQASEANETITVSRSPGSPNVQQRPYSRACKGCNRKKTKCDMQRPICGLCRRTGNECVFPVRRKSLARKRFQAAANTQDVSEKLDRLLAMLEEPAVSRSGFLGQRFSEPANITVVDTAIDTTAVDTTEKVASPSLPSPYPTGASLPLLDESSLGVVDLSPSEPQFGSSPMNSGSLCSPMVPPNGEPSTSASDKSNFKPSRLIMMGVVQAFFDYVQPWLPLLHRPRFTEWTMSLFDHEKDELRELEPDGALLMWSVALLASKFIPTGSATAHLSTSQLQALCLQKSRNAYERARDVTTPTVKFLQGGVLLGCYYYTNGLSAQGWILVGVCLRLLEETMISSVDDDLDEATSPCDFASNADWVAIEELRRLWWVVWELDTFGSIVSRRAFSMSRRHMPVRLPVSDDDWFAGNELSPPKIITTPGSTCMTMLGLKNTNPRAWFLIANYLLSIAHELSWKRGDIGVNDRIILQNDVVSFKMALPIEYRLESCGLSPTRSASEQNFVFGMHIMLCNAIFTSDVLLASNYSFGLSMPTVDYATAVRLRLLTLASILRLWSPEFFLTAHPFLACSLQALPFLSTEPIVDPLLTSCQSLCNFALHRIEEKWGLGRIGLRMINILRFTLVLIWVI